MPVPYLKVYDRSRPHFGDSVNQCFCCFSAATSIFVICVRCSILQPCMSQHPHRPLPTEPSNGPVVGLVKPRLALNFCQFRMLELYAQLTFAMFFNVLDSDVHYHVCLCAGQVFVKLMIQGGVIWEGGTSIHGGACLLPETGLQVSLQGICLIMIDVGGPRPPGQNHPRQVVLSCIKKHIEQAMWRQASRQHSSVASASVPAVFP